MYHVSNSRRPSRPEVTGSPAMVDATHIRKDVHKMNVERCATEALRPTLSGWCLRSGSKAIYRRLLTLTVICETDRQPKNM